MNKKYYVAPAVAVEHVEMESLCAALSGGSNEVKVESSGTGDAGDATSNINIHDVWEQSLRRSSPPSLRSGPHDYNAPTRQRLQQAAPVSALLFFAFFRAGLWKLPIISYFCKWRVNETPINNTPIMTTMQLNAELLRQLSYIADREECMKKALKAIKRIVASRESEALSKSSGLQEALDDVRAGRVYHAENAADLIKQCLE